MADIVQATPQTAAVEELRKTQKKLRVALVGAAFGAIAGLGSLFVALDAQDQAKDAQWRATNAEMRANNAAAQAQQAQNNLGQLRAQLNRPTIQPGAPPLFPPVVRKGKVAATTGDAPVEKGAACRVQVVARGMGDLNCKTTVTCGERVIYGAKSSNGFVLCGVKDGQPTIAADTNGSAESGRDGDPKLDLDLPKGRVVVADGPDSAFEVVVELEP